MINVKKIATIIILTIPITSQYKSPIPGLSLGDVFLLLTTLMILLLNKRVPSIKRITGVIFIFAFYVSVSSLLAILFQSNAAVGDTLVRTTRFLFYVLFAFIISPNFFEINVFLKWYRKIVIFATILIIVQTILNNYFNIVLLGVYQPWISRFDVMDVERLMRSYSNMYRPSSIFIEPAYYARYVLPSLAFNLLSDKGLDKRKFLNSLFISLGLILSTSGQGIVIGLFLWIGSLIKQVIKVNPKNLLYAVSLIPVFYFLSTQRIVISSLNRLFGGEWGSSNTRVFKGYDIFDQLDSLSKLIGTGFGNVGRYMSNNSIQSIYDRSNAVSEYMNSFAYILVNSGILGFLLVLLIFRYLIVNTKYEYRWCIYVLALLSLSGGIIMSSSAIFYFGIIIYGLRQKSDFPKRTFNKMHFN